MRPQRIYYFLFKPYLISILFLKLSIFFIFFFISFPAKSLIDEACIGQAIEGKKHLKGVKNAEQFEDLYSECLCSPQKTNKCCDAVLNSKGSLSALKACPMSMDLNTGLNAAALIAAAAASSQSTEKDRCNAISSLLELRNTLNNGAESCQKLQNKCFNSCNSIKSALEEFKIDKEKEKQRCLTGPHSNSCIEIDREITQIKNALGETQVAGTRCEKSLTEIERVKHQNQNDLAQDRQTANQMSLLCEIFWKNKDKTVEAEEKKIGILNVDVPDLKNLEQNTKEESKKSNFGGFRKGLRAAEQNKKTQGGVFGQKSADENFKDSNQEDKEKTEKDKEEKGGIFGNAKGKQVGGKLGSKEYTGSLNITGKKKVKGNELVNAGKKKDLIGPMHSNIWQQHKKAFKKNCPKVHKCF